MTSQASIETDEERARAGVISAVLAYSMWGALPVYFKLVNQVPVLEVLVHRIVWAVPFGVLIILARKQMPEVKKAFTDRRTFWFLALAAVLIAANWLLYILSVLHEQIFQASLGYYINPLLYVLVGVAFFGERLRRFQIAAIILAAVGVAVLTISGGEFPVIALSLAALFTMYGVIRKQIVIGGMPGLFIETLVLFPLAVLYLIWLMRTGQSYFTLDDPVMPGLLILAGPVTVVPLLFFALAARRLRLSTIGLLQFIAPTLQFIIAVYYGEELTTPHLICFGLIWLAVMLFIYDAWRLRRKKDAAISAN